MNYKAHIETRHQCEHCTLYLPEQRWHICQFPDQRGGHADRGSVDIDQTTFREYSRSNRGAIVSYIHVVPEIVTDFQTLMTSLASAATTLLSQVLATRDAGLRIQFAVHVLWEKVKGQLGDNQEILYEETSLIISPTCTICILQMKLTKSFCHVLLISLARLKKSLNMEVGGM